MLRRHQSSSCGQQESCWKAFQSFLASQPVTCVPSDIAFRFLYFLFYEKQSVLLLPFLDPSGPSSVTLVEKFEKSFFLLALAFWVSQLHALTNYLTWAVFTLDGSKA